MRRSLGGLPRIVWSSTYCDRLHREDPLREYVAAPATFTVDPDWSCVQSAYDRAERTPDNVAFQRPVGGTWTDVTNRESTLR